MPQGSCRRSTLYCALQQSITSTRQQLGGKAECVAAGTNRAGTRPQLQERPAGAGEEAKDLSCDG